jgi:hypothetical protein
MVKSFYNNKHTFMIKAFLTNILILLAITTVTAEDIRTPLTVAHLNSFFKSKTYVVLDDNQVSDYNIKVQDAVKKYWTITPTEFITQNDFQKKRMDANNSFLILSDVVFTNDFLQAKYSFFSLLLGGKYQVIDQMPVLGAVPISYSEAPQESSMYKLGAILKFLQAHILRLKANPELVKEDLYKIYNNDQQTIKDKTLYLVKEEMSKDLNTDAKVKAIYPDKFKFVTRDELEEAIDKNEDGIVFLHKVGPEGTKKRARCYILILGTDSKMYYFDWHMITDRKPDSMLEEDFKKLIKFKNK